MVEPGPIPSEQDLAQADDGLRVALPPTVRELYRGGDGRYRNDGEWWVVWPLDRLVAENIEAWLQGTLPRDFVAFGDDGAGNPFCMPVDGRDEVVRWSPIAQEVDHNVGTMANFTSEWLSPAG